jgi:putative membrane protein
MFAEAANPLLNPWRYQAHPEVWLLVGFLVVAYVYVVRVLGPQVSHVDKPVTRKNIVAFVAAMALLWVGSDWPLHDLAEEYLYSMHMLQHMVLSYFVPPLALLATPEWLFRAMVGDGRTYRIIRWFSKPVIAGVLFNVVVMITHIPGLVNRSAESSPLHYSLHVILVSTALLMWIPICGPARELHMGYAGKMIYLFLMSVVPTVPAAWLTFAEGTVYKHYDIPIRVWGLSVETDQQLAGAIMKTGGAIYLWTIVIYMFFRRFARDFNKDQTYIRSDETLTYDAVEKAFEETPPAPEPRR